MSHFFTVMVVPGTTPFDQIEGVVTRMLAPYSEHRRVAAYKKYLSPLEIRRMANYYHRSAQDPAGLASHMHDWAGDAGGIDKQGLYRLSTSNPAGKWDWWVIGGRWNGEVRGIPEDEVVFKPGGCYKLEDNMLAANQLDHRLTCAALLTPDGIWHEPDQVDWCAEVTDENEEDAWDKEIVRMVQQHLDALLVGVDCHR